MALQLANLLGNALHVRLTLDSILTTPTVAALAKCLDEAIHSQGEEAQKMSRLMEMVEQLSEEEVTRLLAQENSDTKGALE